jgi:hypothetical protein
VDADDVKEGEDEVFAVEGGGIEVRERRKRQFFAALAPNSREIEEKITEAGCTLLLSSDAVPSKWSSFCFAALAAGRITLLDSP